MKRVIAGFLLSITAASAQFAITPPQIGFVLDKSNAVRPVLGVAGSFTLGESIRNGAVSSAFLGSFGFVKTGSTITVFDPDGRILLEQDAPIGPALFGFGLVYMVQTGTLLRWTGSSLEPLSLQFDGEVLSIAQPDPRHALAAVRRDDGLWLLRFSLSSGGLDSQTALPGVEAPVLLLDGGGFVFSESGCLRIRRANATEVPLDSPQLQSFWQIGSGWIQAAASDGRQFAIDIRPGSERIYQLPEAEQ